MYEQARIKLTHLILDVHRNSNIRLALIHCKYEVGFDCIVSDRQEVFEECRVFHLYVFVSHVSYVPW